MLTDALDEWLNTPVVNTQQDPITYWTAMQTAGHPLARMALDFLSIPGKSLVPCVIFSIDRKSVV